MKIMQVITDYITKSILTTHGDLVVRGASIPERLAAVAVGQVLKSAGVGTKPAWGVPNFGSFNIYSTGFASSATEDKVITGVGFQPSFIIFLFGDSLDSNVNVGIGFDDGNVRCCRYLGENGAHQYQDSTKSIHVYRDASNFLTGYILSWDADGFTVRCAETGTAPMEALYMVLG